MNTLAIVIPYYKIDYFEETLKSVAAQTCKDFTVYIGNDASQDDPLPLIEKHLGHLPYFYYDYKDNLGGKNLALQWERILDNVEEDWFQILGDDDMISENFVEEFYKKVSEIKKQNITAVKFVHEWIDEKDQVIGIFNYKKNQLNSIKFFIQKYRGKAKSSLSENIFQTKMYREHRFEKLPLAWGSDDIALIVFSGYGNILYNSNAKVFVRISASSISGSSDFDKKKNNAYNYFREVLITKYANHFPHSFIIEVIDNYISYCYINKQSPNYKVVLYYLLKGNFIKFLKIIKQIHYINKSLK